MSYAVVTVKMQENVRRWAAETLEVLGHPGLTLRIVWSKRFSSRLGDALYRDGVGRVRFSVLLWPPAGPVNRYETVVHEVCHIVAAHENLDRKIYPHGREWKALMLKCGVEAKVCHDVKLGASAPAAPKSPRTESPQKKLRFVREGGRAFMRFD